VVEAAEDLEALTRLIESGAVTPVIDCTYALATLPMRSVTSPKGTPQERSSSPGDPPRRTTTSRGAAQVV